MTLGTKKQQKISTEELAKTQVLNLDDVQKLAKYEKIVSKKPAMYVALVGAFSMIVGLTSQAVVSLSAMNETVTPQQNKVKTEETTNVNTNQLICTHVEANAGAEINIETTYTLNFENDETKSYVKTVDVTPTSTSSVTALTSIQNGTVAFNALAKNSTTGYKVVVSNKESGYQVVTSVDTEKLDNSTVAQENMSNVYVSPDITPNVTKDVAKTYFENNGYTCK